MRTNFKFFLLILAIIGQSCGGEDKQKEITIEFVSKEESKVSKESKQNTSLASQTIDLENKGIGPIQSVVLKEMDEALVKEGEMIHKTLCAACHRTDKKFIGPPFKDILKRRTPEWVMNMILNPIEMVKKDPLAKALFEEYEGSLMANQNLSEDQARAVLEYMRSL